MSSETIMFNVSATFKEALEKFSGKLNEARAATIRRLVAEGIGYDMSTEPKSARVTKYASPEERKAAAKARDKKRRDLTNQLLAAYEQEDNEGAIKALVASLKEASEDGNLQEAVVEEPAKSKK